MLERRSKIKTCPPHSFQARVNGECVGAIVCKLDYHKKIVKRGYIAMLAVDSGHRKRKIGSTLVKRAIDAMIAEEADEVYLKITFIFLKCVNCTLFVFKNIGQMIIS